ncbi:hypothetical protein AB6E88_09755 [Providencia hangzhouensis]
MSFINSSFPSVSSAQELKGGVIGNLKYYSNKKHQSEINNVKYSEKNIDELGFILYDLIQRQDFDKINEIIGNYVDHKDHDKELVKYIHSERAVLNKQYDLAISLYNEILIHKPNMLLVELKLAQALLMLSTMNQHYQYIKISKLKYKEKRISNGLTKFIKSQIIDLENKNRWQGTIKLGSSYDFNLNEASNSREMYCFRSKCMNRVTSLSLVESGIIILNYQSVFL